MKPSHLSPALRGWVADNLLRGLPVERIAAELLAHDAVRAGLMASDDTPDDSDGIPDGSNGTRNDSDGMQNDSNGIQGNPNAIPNDSDGMPDDSNGISLTVGDTLSKRVEAAVSAIAASPELQAGRRATARLRQLELIHRMGRLLAETDATPEDIPRRPGLSAERFYAEHYAAWQPVVLPGFADDWPARRWTPESLAERFGAVEVKVTDERESDPDYDMHTPAHTRVLPLSAFVERIRGVGESNDCYMVAQNRVLEDPKMAPLMADVPFDEAWFRPERWKGCAALWLGPAGTVTPLHHDTCNILFVQLYGRKRITLASPLETTLLDGARSMYAAVDPEQHDGAVRFKRAVLEPGDAIFLPVGWWHHVRALDVSVSLALTNLRRRNSFDWYRPGEAR